MKPLRIGITGVRGIVGETFTPEVAVGFAQAFGTYLAHLTAEPTWFLSEVP